MLRSETYQRDEEESTYTRHGTLTIECRWDAYAKQSPLGEPTRIELRSKSEYLDVKLLDIKRLTAMGKTEEIMSKESQLLMAVRRNLGNVHPVAEIYREINNAEPLSRRMEQDLRQRKHTMSPFTRPGNVSKESGRKVKGQRLVHVKLSRRRHINISARKSK